MWGPGGRNDRDMMLTTQTTDSQENTPTFDLPATTPSVVDRLEAYGLLPPSHRDIPERALVLLEQLFVTWYELGNDPSRRAALPYLFATDDDLRATLLAVVPLYHDPLFFDELTPTRELTEIALLAHAKWRAWLDGTRC